MPENLNNWKILKLLRCHREKVQKNDMAEKAVKNKKPEKAKKWLKCLKSGKAWKAGRGWKWWRSLQCWKACKGWKSRYLEMAENPWKFLKAWKVGEPEIIGKAETCKKAEKHRNDQNAWKVEKLR